MLDRRGFVGGRRDSVEQGDESQLPLPCLLDLLALGEVLADAAEAAGATVGLVHDLGADRHVPDLARRAHDGVLELELALGVQSVVQPRADSRSVAWMHRGQMSVERTVELARLDAVNAVQLLGPLHGAGAGVPAPQADVGEVLELVHARLALCERGLEQLLLGEVADEDKGTARTDGHSGDRHRHDHAVMAEGAGVEGDERLAGAGALDDLGAAFLRREQRVGIAADRVGFGVAEQALRGSRPTRDCAVGAQAERRLARRFDEGAQARQLFLDRLGCRRRLVHVLHSTAAPQQPALPMVRTVTRRALKSVAVVLLARVFLAAVPALARYLRMRNT